jgi:hypothetical protein
MSTQLTGGFFAGVHVYIGTYPQRAPVIFFLSNKQADDYFAAFGYQAHKEEFCHSRGVFFHHNRCTIGWHVLTHTHAVTLRSALTTTRRHLAP